MTEPVRTAWAPEGAATAGVRNKRRAFRMKAAGVKVPPAEWFTTQGHGSLGAAARATGYHRSTMSKMVNGYLPWTGPAMKALSDYTNDSIDFTGAPPPKTRSSRVADFSQGVCPIEGSRTELLCSIPVGGHAYVDTDAENYAHHMSRLVPARYRRPNVILDAVFRTELLVCMSRAIASPPTYLIRVDRVA